MDKYGDSQLDLFSQGSNSQDLRNNGKNPFFARIWNYEKTILIMLLFLVTAIVAFSLGVEKGKGVISDNQGRALVLASAQSAPTASQVIVRKEAIQQAAKPIIKQQGVFTIQVATFKARANALKEAESIKKLGLGTVLFAKNGYFILCAGNFPSKESASGLLAELNKRYKNCQIRRL